MERLPYLSYNGGILGTYLLFLAVVFLAAISSTILLHTRTLCAKKYRILILRFAFVGFNFFVSIVALGILWSECAFKCAFDKTDCQHYWSDAC